MNLRFAICDWGLARQSSSGIRKRRALGDSDLGFQISFGFQISDFKQTGVFLSGLLLVLFTGCRREMFQQASSKPLEKSEFFQENKMASRPMVPHTVARGHLNEDEAFYHGKIGTNLVTEFPFPITREILERGRERFDIYCAPCHGRTGDGNGMIVQRGYPPPPSYHIDRLRNAPVGHFYDVITQGYGVMYPYATRVEPRDRWAITAYIRALQLSQNASLTNLSTDEQAKLKAK